jgi:hypothetical protein
MPSQKVTYECTLLVFHDILLANTSVENHFETLHVEFALHRTEKCTREENTRKFCTRNLRPSKNSTRLVAAIGESLCSLEVTELKGYDA